jgi:CheY-like chemotaxis protein
LLKGNAASEAIVQRDDEIKLGAFKTVDAKVLLVDDNPVNLIVAEGLMRQYGLEVTTTNCGQMTINMVQEKDFDIVFMDYMMPDMDGIDTTKAIRALGGRFETQLIVALSADAISGVEEMFLEAGMNDFLSKPIVINELHQILLKHLPKEKVLSIGG